MQATRRIWIKELLWALVFAGLVAAFFRFAYGLGYTTGLNDTTPWGLWIAFKLGFVALAGGGFTLAAMVYLFHLESYRPLLRRAILLALLGYGSFIVSLIFDLGLPWHIYMPVIHWQHHSVMFEIAWCVMLYFSALALEFGPVILEHPWFRGTWFQVIYKLLKAATVPLVIAGVVLSTLHQSSLGALFLIMPHRVHPLWYSPWIPVLFFTSAIAAGLMALVVESYLAARWFGRGLHADLLARVGKIAGFVLWLYLALRVGDLLVRGALPDALDGSWQSMVFAGEILLGGVLPGVLLMFPSLRNRAEGLLTCAVLVIAGVLSQRMSLSLFSMWRPAGQGYVPSLLEVVIALAIPAAAGLVYFLFSENLAVLEKTLPERQHDRYARPELAPGSARYREDSLRSALVRRSGLAVAMAALIFAGLPAASGRGQPMPATVVKAATGWEALLIDGNRQGYAVAFPHGEHQQRLAEEAGDEVEACATCHHLNKPGDQASRCSECHQDYYAATSIFNHNLHVAELGGNAACSECHNGEHRRETAAACQECHEDMAPAAGQNAFDYLAPGYQEALHGKCQGCHTQEAAAQGRPELQECATCHTQKSGDLIQALADDKQPFNWPWTGAKSTDFNDLLQHPSPEQQ